MRWRSVFLGPGGIRAGWRYASFWAISTALSAIPPLALQAAGFRNPTTLTPGILFANELIQFAGVFVAIAIMARIERRRIAAYGFTARGAFGARFWIGALWGIAAVSAVVGLIAWRGGYTLGAPAFAGAALLRASAMWALTTTAIGVAEELEFRGYSLYTFASGMGFWPGAVLISLMFAGLHYFFKPGETWVDAASVGLIGLFFCLTVRRTGSLWFAIGWHAAFNFGQFCLWGGPNSANRGLPFPGRLFASSFHGPAWLTGGGLGIEASAFVFPVIAASYALLVLVYRGSPWPDFAARAPAAGGAANAPAPPAAAASRG